MARLASEFFVAAFVRRHADLGRICVVSKRGDVSAGAIWVEVDRLDGTLELYGPAPSAMHEDGMGRKFTRRKTVADAHALAEWRSREENFDPDFWLITLETRNGEHGLDLAED